MEATLLGVGRVHRAREDWGFWAMAKVCGYQRISDDGQNQKELLEKSEHYKLGTTSIMTIRLCTGNKICINPSQH